MDLPQVANLVCELCLHGVGVGRNFYGWCDRCGFVQYNFNLRHDLPLIGGQLQKAPINESGNRSDAIYYR